MNSGSSERSSSRRDEEPRVHDGVDPGDDRFRGDARRLLLVRLQAPQLDEVGEAPDRLAPLGQGLGSGRVHLDDEHPADVRLDLEVAERGAQPCPQPSPPVALAGGRCGRERLDPRHAHVVGLQVAAVLAAKVVVEGLAIDAGVVEHGLHRRCLVAAAPDDLEHAVNDPLPHRGGHQLQLGCIGEAIDNPPCAGSLSPCPDLGRCQLAHSILSPPDQGNALSSSGYCSGIVEIRPG